MPSASDQALVEFRAKLRRAKGVRFAISTAPEPCGSACAVDLDKTPSAPVLSPDLKLKANKAYPGGDDTAAILPSIPAHSRRIK